MSLRKKRAAAKRASAAKRKQQKPNSVPKPTRRRRRRSSRRQDAIEPEVVDAKPTSRSRIDMATLAKMVDDGRTNDQIAAFFKCNVSLVKVKVSELDEWRNHQLAKNPTGIGDKSLDVLDQIMTMNNNTQDLNDKFVSHFSKRFIVHDDLDFAKTWIQLQKEIREELKFYVEYLEKVYNISSITILQESILETLREIRDEHPEVAGKIAGLLGSSETAE